VKPSSEDNLAADARCISDKDGEKILRVMAVEHPSTFYTHAAARRLARILAPPPLTGLTYYLPHSSEYLPAPLAPTIVPIMSSPDLPPAMPEPVCTLAVLATSPCSG
jgi:hypothetical protein